jgi:hypothetical protein
MVRTLILQTLFETYLTISRSGQVLDQNAVHRLERPRTKSSLDELR